MPLKLTGVHVENFRKFREPFLVDLHGPAGAPLDYVVLAGPNGCGKTTILEAILIALGREDVVARSRATNGTPAAAGWQMAVSSKVSLRMEREDGREFLLGRRHGGVRYGLSPGDAPASWGHGGIGAAEHVPEVMALKVEYISSRRRPSLLGPVEPTTGGHLPDDTEANRLTRFKMRLMQQIQRRFPGYTGPEPRDQVWLARLNAFWREFRDDGTEFSLQLVDPDNLDAAAWDLYLSQGTQRLHSSDVMSSGELELLAMVAPLITSDFDGLLLFDEPELHMHPEWQGAVVRAIRRLIPAAQIIVATHADDPWDDAMSWQRFLLVPDTDPRSAKWRADHADQTVE